MKLHWKIIIGMVAGVVFGLLMSQTSFGSDIIKDWIKPFGTIFINLLKLIPYYFVGLLAPSNLMISLILLPLAFVSVLIGYFIQKKIPEKLFFNIVYILLFLYS